jgi:hypothetical protein
MIRFLPNFALVACFFLFLPNHKLHHERTFVMLDNGCLIYSLHHKFLLEANEKLEPYLWTRTLAIQFYVQPVTGHAVNVFVYKNMTFVYDPAKGSYPVARYPIYDPMTIAEICYPNLFIRSAAFIEPTITLENPMF